MRQERQPVIEQEPLSTVQRDQLVKASTHLLGTYKSTEEFFEEFPREARILFDNLANEDRNEPWSTRFASLEKLFALWNIREVDDTLVNQILEVAYDRTHERHSHWENQSRKIASIRAGQSVETIDTIRRMLPEKPSFEDTKRYELFSVIEDAHHPLAHLIPKLGYEVETASVSKISYDKMNILDLLGFHTDQDIHNSPGLTEYAHGPFRNWQTASYSLGKFISVGAIDLYSAYGQSMHTNIGVVYNDGFPVLNRWLMATGWAYQPLFGTDTVNSRNFDMWIRPKEREEMYMESKEFRLIDYRSAVKHFRAAQLLAAGLEAFQNTQLCYYTSSSDLIYTQRRIGTLQEPDIAEMKRKPDISQKIDKTNLTPTQKRLAHIWYESTKLLKKGFSSVGLYDVWDQRVPLHEENYFAKQFTDVYPDKRWKAIREISSPDEITTKPVSIGGFKYPNIISFARHLANDTTQSIQTTLNHAEQQFNARVIQICRPMARDERNKMVNTLFRDYPCGFTPQTTMIEKHEFIANTFERLTREEEF
jgi:hypothetical protein